MKIKHLLCLVSLLAFISFVNKAGAQVNTRDSFALVDLYNSTGGPNWKSHTNWLTIKPVATWYGITVRNNHVVNIALGYNRMTGSLPSSLGNLDSLQILSITNNYTNLTGSIPASIGSLHRLTLLDLNANGFIGSLPFEIGNIDSLQKLNVSNNSLSGELPSSIGRLKKLASFDASYNRTGSGHISGNGFSGAIPDSLGYCASLSLLNLSYNTLTGKIPSTFKYLTHLSRIELATNHLSGQFTNVFADNNVLEYLNLAGNRFSGKVPTFFSQFTHLSTLILAANLFSGPIPSALSDATSLVELDISSNGLTGGIPASLNELPLLIRLNVALNKLTGKLPLLSNNYSVTNPDLDVSYNSLTTDRNPQYRGKQVAGIFNLSNNRFTFNGLEYISKKYYTLTDAPQANLVVNLYNNKLAVSAGGTLSRNTYKWYKTGMANPVTITGDSTYQPATSGQYFVNVTNSIVKFLTLTSDTIFYTTSGVNSNTAITVSIYPNPVKGMITINGLNDKADSKITIADMSGHVWMSAMSRRQITMKIDASGLKTGNYLVSVSDRKEVKTIQFVKE